MTDALKTELSNSERAHVQNSLYNVPAAMCVIGERGIIEFLNDIFREQFGDLLDNSKRIAKLLIPSEAGKDVFHPDQMNQCET